MDGDDNTRRNKRPRLHSPDRDGETQQLPHTSLDNMTLIPEYPAEWTFDLRDADLLAALLADSAPQAPDAYLPVNALGHTEGLPPMSHDVLESRHIQQPFQPAVSNSMVPFGQTPPPAAAMPPTFVGLNPSFNFALPFAPTPLPASSTSALDFTGYDFHYSSSAAHTSSLYYSTTMPTLTVGHTQSPSVGSITHSHAAFEAPPTNTTLYNTVQTADASFPVAHPRLETSIVQHQLQPPSIAFSVQAGGADHNRRIPPSHHQTPASPTQPIFAITGGNHFDNRGTRVRNHIYYQAASTSGMAPDTLRNHSAPNAMHSSLAVTNQGICMPGTRAFTLQRLQSLLGSVEDTDPDLVWMHGPAGAGKSAIMRTMANALEEQKVLLGSFFFFRADSQRNTCIPFIPTLALQAITSLPATHDHVQDAVQTQHTIFTQSIERQFRFLLETPLTLAAHDEATWRADTPFVIVIDGLDECSDADRQVEIIRAMCRLVSTIRSSTGRRIKVLIASRPEARIKEELETDGDSVTIVKLDPGDANIDLYYDIRLDEIRRRNKLPESWPALQQIWWLKGKTSGQYSFAHISMGFLGGGDPIERLKMLEVGIGTHGLEPFEALDALYAFVLHQVPPEMRQSTLRVIWLVDYMGSVHQGNHHLVEDALALPLGYLRRVYPYLSSILKEDNFLPHHASLFDFLGDPVRSERYSLSIDPSILLTALVEGVLRIGITASEHGRMLDLEDMKVFANGVIRTKNNLHRDLCHISPRILEALAILPSLLPTMDALGFGYYRFILSLLEDTPYFLQTPDTLRPLLDQISALQQIHFAPYILLEQEGDSGIALFGLLLVVASAVMQNEEFPDVYPYGLEVVVPNMIRNNQHLLSPISPVILPQSRILHEVAHRSCTTERPHNNWWTTNFYIWAFVPSLPDNIIPRECLWRTVELFLDLPSATTHIQTQLVDSRFDNCPSHAMFHAQCKRCLLTLESLQIVGLRVVYWFWWCTYGFMDKGPRSWSFNLDAFARASEFVMGTTSLTCSTMALLSHMRSHGSQYVHAWTNSASPELDLERLKGIVAKLDKRCHELKALLDRLNGQQSGMDEESDTDEESAADKEGLGLEDEESGMEEVIHTE